MRNKWRHRQGCSGVEHAMPNRLLETSRTRRRPSAPSAVWRRSPRHSQLALHLRYPTGPDRPSRPTPHAHLDFLVSRHHPFLQIERLSNRSALTLPRRSRYHGSRKLARRCCKHPGPWRHLNGQVMRIDCTTRRPAPDRRRVFLVSWSKEEGGRHGEKRL